MKKNDAGSFYKGKCLFVFTECIGHWNTCYSITTMSILLFVPFHHGKGKCWFTLNTSSGKQNGSFLHIQTTEIGAKYFNIYDVQGSSYGGLPLAKKRKKVGNFFTFFREKMIFSSWKEQNKGFLGGDTPSLFPNPSRSLKVATLASPFPHIR